MGIPVLYTRLEGLLQSWGDSGKWDNRPTNIFPTKSGVVGMFACAMGLRRGDPRIAEISNALGMAVRCNEPGEIMTDYQIVHGYFAQADGKIRKKTQSKIRNKEYLSGASFTVAVTGDPELLEEIQAALLNPKWPLYLGRKACIPSRPIIGTLTTEFSSLEDALSVVDNVEQGKVYSCEFECDPSYAMYTKSDLIAMPSNNLAKQTYRHRSVTRKDVVGCVFD